LLRAISYYQAWRDIILSIANPVLKGIIYSRSHWISGVQHSPRKDFNVANPFWNPWKQKF